MGAKEAVLATLQQLVGEDKYKAWFANETIRFCVEKDSLVIETPNVFYSDFIQHEFNEQLQAAAVAAGCTRYATRASPAIQEAISKRQTEGVPRVLTIPQPKNPHEQLVNTLTPYLNRLIYNAAHLDQRYANPSRLIIDTNNRIVHDNLDDLLLWMRNPQHERQSQSIYIEAGSGMGKTSLLQGVSWSIFREIRGGLKALIDCRVKPGDAEFDYLMRISKFAFRYITARKFVEDVIRPVKFGKSQGQERLPGVAQDFGVTQYTIDPGWEFFRRIYDQLDVLIIDDIQDIARPPGRQKKEAFSGTKNQLFKIIDDLLAKEKSIIIASDVPAEELKQGMPARLFNRICQGLRLKVSPPSTSAKIKVFYMNAVGAGLGLKPPRSEDEQDHDPVYQQVSDLAENAVGYRDIERFVTNIKGRRRKEDGEVADSKALVRILLDLKSEEALHQEKIDDGKIVEQIKDVAARLANKPTWAELRAATDSRSVTAKRAAELTAYQLTTWETRKLGPVFNMPVKDYEALLASNGSPGRLNPRTKTIESVITDHFVQLTQAPKPAPKPQNPAKKS